MYDGNFSAFSDTKRRQDQLNSLTVQNECVHSPLRSLVAFKSIVWYFLALYGIIDLNTPANPVNVSKPKGQKLKQRKYGWFRATHKSNTGPEGRYPKKGQGSRSALNRKQDSTVSTSSQRQDHRGTKKLISQDSRSQNWESGPKSSSDADTVSDNNSTNLAEQKKVCLQMVDLLDSGQSQEVCKQMNIKAQLQRESYIIVLGIGPVTSWGS